MENVEKPEDATNGTTVTLRVEHDDDDAFLRPLIETFETSASVVVERDTANIKKGFHPLEIIVNNKDFFTSETASVLWSSFLLLVGSQSGKWVRFLMEAARRDNALRKYSIVINFDGSGHTLTLDGNSDQKQTKQAWDDMAKAVEIKRLAAQGGTTLEQIRIRHDGTDSPLVTAHSGHQLTHVLNLESGVITDVAPALDHDLFQLNYCLDQVDYLTYRAQRGAPVDQNRLQHLKDEITRLKPLFTC